MAETAKKQNKELKKLFLRFFVSLLTTAILSFTAFAVYSAAQAETTTAPAVTTAAGTTDAAGAVTTNESSALYDLIGVDASEPLEVILLITVLSVAPSLLIMLTSFTRIIIVFSFLRSAMQTQATPPNTVMTGLALFLTVFIMWPVFSEMNEIAYEPYQRGELTTWEAVEKAGEPLKTFMLKQTSNSNMSFFLELGKKTIYTNDTVDSDSPVEANAEEITLTDYQEQLGFEIVIPAFIVSELTRAFQMGFMLFIPFLIIDLVVSSTLMSMGMMMLPPAMISLPFKILLFVMVDGWQLLVGTLVSSFN